MCSLFFSLARGSLSSATCDPFLSLFSCTSVCTSLSSPLAPQLRSSRLDPAPLPPSLASRLVKPTRRLDSSTKRPLVFGFPQPSPISLPTTPSPPPLQPALGPSPPPRLLLALRLYRDSIAALLPAVFLFATALPSRPQGSTDGLSPVSIIGRHIDTCALFPRASHTYRTAHRLHANQPTHLFATSSSPRPLCSTVRKRSGLLKPRPLDLPTHRPLDAVGLRLSRLAATPRPLSSRLPQPSDHLRARQYLGIRSAQLADHLGDRRRAPRPSRTRGGDPRVLPSSFPTSTRLLSHTPTYCSIGVLIDLHAMLPDHLHRVVEPLAHVSLTAATCPTSTLPPLFDVCQPSRQLPSS